MEQPPVSGSEPGQDQEADDRRVQRFAFGMMEFNIDRGQQIAAEDIREVDDLPVAPWAKYYGLDETDQHKASFFAPQHLDRDYAMTTNLDKPVLVATLRNSRGRVFSLLIDGVHRLYKAYRQGILVLPAYLLDEAESLSIREDPFVNSPVHLDGYSRARLVGDADRPERGTI